MFALERIRIIRKYLDEHRQAEVHTLSSLLDVSEVTVRRDLEKLERDGYLTRTHGGAVINTPQDLSIPAAVESPSQEQQEIAEVALCMIEDDDIIMLTNGGINLQIARKLESRHNVTVLTNDLLIALALSSQQYNRSVLLGGDIDPDDKALFGSMTMENLQKYYVNRLFIEVDGCGKELQLTVAHEKKASLIRAAMSVARESIVLCTAEQFTSSAFFRLGGVEIADKVITNQSLPDAFKNELFLRNVPLFTSIHAFEGSV